MSNGYEEGQTNLLAQIATKGLVTVGYNEIDFSPSSAQPITITYLQNGTTVATLTLTYSGSDITSIVRT